MLPYRCSYLNALKCSLWMSHRYHFLLFWCEVFFLWTIHLHQWVWNFVDTHYNIVLIGIAFERVNCSLKCINILFTIYGFNLSFGAVWISNICCNRSVNLIALYVKLSNTWRNLMSSAYIERPMQWDMYSNVLYGALKYYDLPDLIRLSNCPICFCRLKNRIHFSHCRSILNAQRRAQ